MVINYCIVYNQERKCDIWYFNALFWVYIITLPLAWPIIMIQFLIILGSLFHRNPPLNINFPMILIFLISYNITFGSSHPNRIDYRAWRLHKNKTTNKQVTKMHVCGSVQRRVHASRPIVWRDDKIFRVNINNGGNGCMFIISFPIAKRPKAFQ
jgi:hypothetical protein